MRRWKTRKMLRSWKELLRKKERRPLILPGSQNLYMVNTLSEAKKLIWIYMTPISGWEVLGLKRRLKGLLLLHKIGASSLETFRLIFFIMGLTLDVDSAIQAPRLLTTSSQGALFLPQMSIQIDIIVLGNIYTGKSVTTIILKHPTNGMSTNRYLLWIPQRWPFSGISLLELTEQYKLTGQI